MGNLVKQVKEETVDKVEERIKEFVKHGGLEVPENYHVGNALKSAWLNLQTVEISKKQGGGLAIEKCTQESVINSLLDMVVQGLSVAKKQGYFIAYNDQLSFQRSYFGTLAVTKRLSEVKDVRYQVIYDDDIFEIAIKDGEKIISRHETNLDNIDNNKIIGAYVIIVKYDGTFYTEIMKMQDIKQSWKQSRTAWAIFEQEKDRTLTDNLKADSVHGKFTDQMVLKTVINRACKNFANTNTSDNDIFIDAVNRTTDNEFLRDGETLPEPKKDIKQLIEEEAGKQTLDFPTTISSEPDFQGYEKTEATIVDGQIIETESGVSVDEDGVIQDEETDRGF